MIKRNILDAVKNRIITIPTTTFIIPRYPKTGNEDQKKPIFNSGASKIHIAPGNETKIESKIHFCSFARLRLPISKRSALKYVDKRLAV